MKVLCQYLQNNGQVRSETIKYIWKKKESSIYHLLGIPQNENHLKKGGKNALLTAFSTERVQGILEDFILFNQIDRVLFKKKKKIGKEAFLKQ